MADNRSFNQNEQKSDKLDVGKLLRDGAEPGEVMRRLREAYPNDRDLVGRIFNEYTEKNDEIRRRAQKFATQILTLYNNEGPETILKRAHKIKVKRGYSDDEFRAFMRVALSDRTFTQNSMYNFPNTAISRTLGYTQETSVGRLDVKPAELDVLQEILKLYETYGTLHQQVVIQSMIYKDCDLPATRGKYDPARHNVFNYVHPILAALFLPRIKYIDEHMLIANIAGIVATRHKGQNPKTLPDYDLYWDITHDPNEAVCSGSLLNNKDYSPLSDLRNRAKLQVEIWKAVHSLRQGQYYNAQSTDLMMALDTCRNGVFDSPELYYVKDEGSILRKLFGVFSLRPTIVSVTPITGSNSVITGNFPINPQALTQITYIPMVNLRIPHQNAMNVTGTSINLSEALSQPDFFVENKMIIPKMRSIIDSRGLIVFYVNRRFQQVNMAKLSSPYAFNYLPTTVGNFESMNRARVSFNPLLTLGNENYDLRSVVLLTTIVLENLEERMPDGRSRQDRKEIITGCAAGIIRLENTQGDLTIGRAPLLYAPQNANMQYLDDKHELVNNDPVTVMNQSGSQLVEESESFEEAAETRGTIYIYVKQHKPVVA